MGFSSRVYDPLGFLSPVYKAKVDWDEPLPSELLCKWKCLVSNLEDVVISVLRCYITTGTVEDCVLYGFRDALKLAYSAVVYMYDTVSDSVQFVVSKTRVAPLVQMTILRLELLSCLLLARLIL